MAKSENGRNKRVIMSGKVTTISLGVDLEIIQEVIAGQTHRFELLIKKYNQQLYRIGMAYLKNEEDTEDAMQSTYLKSFEKLTSFQGNSSFSTWLIKIMINECLLLLRKNERKGNEVISNHLKTYEPDGAQKLIDTEMKALLETAILKLPEKYRVVYIFRAINELSTQETAGLLQITTENVKVRFHRAKLLMKDAILKQAGETEVFSFLGNRCDLLTKRTMRLILMSI